MNKQMWNQAKHWRWSHPHKHTAHTDTHSHMHSGPYGYTHTHTHIDICGRSGQLKSFYSYSCAHAAFIFY